MQTVVLQTFVQFSYQNQAEQLNIRLEMWYQCSRYGALYVPYRLVGEEKKMTKKKVVCEWRQYTGRK